MKKILLSSALLAASLSAYTITDLNVNFKAFKTYEKIGVGGKFDQVSYTKADKKTIEEMLLNSKVEITTANVNSANADRDKKLVASFFNAQNVKKIDAKIISVTQKNVIVQIAMNNKTLDIPMSYTNEKNKITAQGTIDLADFALLPSLASINKACYELHKGKTWQDVDISFEITYK
jgi:polyisoprenoid-binding protein YceI